MTTIYPNVLYHADSGITIFIDTLQSVSDSPGAVDVVTYQSSVDGNVHSFTREVGAHGISINGTISTDNEDIITRQLEYIKGKNIYLMLGSNNIATLAILDDYSKNKSVMTHTSISLSFTCKHMTLGYFWESDHPDTTSNSATVTADANATCGYTRYFNTSSGAIGMGKTQADYLLPVGNYTMFARIRDTNQVGLDTRFKIYNSTNGTTLGTGAKTITADYKIYTFDFVVASDDVGDRIYFLVEKEYSTTNTIYVDFFGFVRNE